MLKTGLIGLSMVCVPIRAAAKSRSRRHARSEGGGANVAARIPDVEPSTAPTHRASTSRDTTGIESAREYGCRLTPELGCHRDDVPEPSGRRAPFGRLS